MRTPADMPRPLPRTSRRLRVGILVAVVVVILLLTTARGAARFYTSYLWFEEVGFTSVFRGVLVTKVLLAVVFCVLFFLMMLASLTVADRSAPLEMPEDTTDELVVRYRDVVSPVGRWVRIAAAVIFALFAGVGTNKEWNNFDLFRYNVSFGVKDPVYHKDVGFYVFELPFIKFLLGWAFEAVIVVLIVTVVAQYLNGGIRFQGAGPRVTPAVKTHISLLLGVLAIIQGVNYYFDRLQLVLSTSHVVDGATATSIHANKPADELLIFIAFIAAVLFLINIRAKGWTLPVVGVIVWVLVWILVGNIYPALYQSLRVNPSELTRETPYINRNIAATRTAYGLNDVKVAKDSDFDDASSTVSAAQVNGDSAQAQSDRATLANVQLLDPNQILNTFDQLQSLRQYYSINSLSVDRYQLNGALTETLMGVRELNSQVPSGFTNQHLQYTHGYGAAVAPANESGVAASGKPAFSLSNVPPQGVPSLTSASNDTGSQVYYGEGSTSNGFVIADSKQQEIDYQAADGTEIASHYTGSGGVAAGGLLRRAAFALSFGDADILLSGQVTPKSRIVYNRNIVSRVKKAAPFLSYDADPYSVIINDQIYWVVDAYTTTANYPYAQDASTARLSSSSGLDKKLNYVRNSVKVVINAYTGKMHYFVVDPSDPIIRVYERAFPDLFTPGSQADKVIPGITAHWRYPEDLFEVQTNMFGRYHLTNTDAFYDESTAWSISQDPGSGAPGTGSTTSTETATGQVTSRTKLVDPTYEVAAMPGQTTQQFLIQQSFVPYSPSSTRQNLTAVLFASADQNDYGQLTLYETPPGETVNGLDLIQSIISNTAAISNEFTLLNQQSSEVRLGELVTVPIANTLLYVQPVYVQATSNKIPILRDVIVVYDGVAYHSENASLDAALCAIKNPDSSSPFARYCNTAPAKRTKTPVTSQTPGGSGTGSGSTTTTTPTTAPTTSTTVPPSPVTSPSGQTVSQLLGDAERAYTAAQSALKAGDLATYQHDVDQAEADVAEASRLETSSSTTTTTVPARGGASPKGASTTTTTTGG